MAINLTDPVFTDETKAREHLEAIRWPDGPYCPHCGETTEIFKHGGGKKTAELLKVPFLGEIPLDPKVTLGGDSGRPIVAGEPESGVTKAYLAIAETIAPNLQRYLTGDLPDVLGP